MHRRGMSDEMQARSQELSGLGDGNAEAGSLLLAACSQDVSQASPESASDPALFMICAESKGSLLELEAMVGGREPVDTSTLEHEVSFVGKARRPRLGDKQRPRRPRSMEGGINDLAQSVEGHRAGDREWPFCRARYVGARPGVAQGIASHQQTARGLGQRGVRRRATVAAAEPRRPLIRSSLVWRLLQQSPPAATGCLRCPAQPGGYRCRECPRFQGIARQPIRAPRAVLQTGNSRDR